MSVGIEVGRWNDEALRARFPLHRACRDGDVGVLRSLLRRAARREDLVAEDSLYGWTPIHWAAHFGKLECVVHLVQVGCEVDSATTRFAQTPVHIAAFGGHPHCVLWLLRAGAQINRQDYVGETPIHKAARAGSRECTEALLLHGAKADVRNASGLMAADLASSQGFWELVQLLSNFPNYPVPLSGGPHHAPDPLGGAANRKRLNGDWTNGFMKKARTDDGDLYAGVDDSAAEELDGMNVEAAEDELSGNYNTKGLSNGHGDANMSAAVHCPLPPRSNTAGPASFKSAPPSPRRASAQSSDGTESPFTPTNHKSPDAATGQRRSSDMCGSLHLTGSPSSCVSHRPALGTTASGAGDSLIYGHYHGFGDTAEDLTDTSISGHLQRTSSFRLEQRYNQAAV